MFATLIIQMPLQNNGKPVVNPKTLLSHLTPVLNHAIAEAIPEGNLMVPISKNCAAGIHWSYHIRAEADIHRA